MGKIKRYHSTFGACLFEFKKIFFAVYQILLDVVG